MGVKGWCKSCESDYGRTPKAKKRQKERWIRYMSDPKNREHERRRSKLKYNPDQARDCQLRNIGTTLKKFRLSKKCTLCKRRHRLVADHNHKTNLYRGAICHLCNLVLGHIENFPKLFSRIPEYLRRGLGVPIYQS